MFQPSGDKVERARPITRVTKIDASVKGWHMNESISAMDPQAAVQLDNWYPEPSGLRLRYGAQIYCSCAGTTAPVNTLMTYLSGTTQKLFAGCNNAIYDATNSGPPTAPLSQGGFHSDAFQWINFATPAGQFLVICNGNDSVWTYGPSGTGGALQWQVSAITGPTEPLINVWSFMGHLFFAEAQTDIVWWLPANQISGTAQSIPMGSMLAKGGTIIGGGQWTFAAGNAVDNLCVIVSSEGEVIVYSGTDPSSASTWSKVGQFAIGRPIGYRCILQVNSDMVVMCEDGLMPMSKAMEYDRAAASRAAFTWDIQKAFADAYQSYSNVFGWQILNYAWNHMAIVNVPSGTGASPPGNWQFVMDLLTGAWCRYLGLDALSWAVMEDRIFFGDRNGKVWLAENGPRDISDFSGTFKPISGTWVSAYNDLDAPGRLKSARAIRVVFLSDIPFTPNVGISTDYNYIAPPAMPRVDPALPGSTQTNWVSAIGDSYQMAATVTASISNPPAGGWPGSNVHVYITAAYVLNEVGAWLG